MSEGAANRIQALALHDLRILRRDPAFLVIFTVVPLAFMAFNKDSFAAALSVEFAGRGFNGSEQIVPGATVLFSGFLVGNLGFSIFREHGWGTWERLRASQLSTAELLLAKSVAPVLSLAFQLVVLLVGGAVLFDLRVRGSLFAFGVVAAALAIMEVTLGFMLLSLCRSVVQLNALTNAGAMLLGGLGGAVTPIEFLPGWARFLAPATPAYWAMRGFRSVLFDGAGVGAVVRPVATLLAFSLVFVVVAARRFRIEETKVSWA
ncbi:MAG: ABC transporter permease [Acidimicrobiales bacterium]